MTKGLLFWFFFWGGGGLLLASSSFGWGGFGQWLVFISQNFTMNFCGELPPLSGI